MEKDHLKIQDYLSLGYLVLLLLGLLREAIYYRFIGVNIMTYTSITDVLLSPLAYLVKEPILFAFFFIILYLTLIQSRLRKKYKDRAWYKRIFKMPEPQQVPSNSSFFPPGLLVIVSMIVLMLLGTGIGAGIKASDSLKKGKLKKNDELTFVDGKKKNVAILGQNSAFIFYVEDDNKTVTVTPINGVVKKIKVK